LTVDRADKYPPVVVRPQRALRTQVVCVRSNIVDRDPAAVSQTLPQSAGKFRIKHPVRGLDYLTSPIFTIRVIPETQLVVILERSTRPGRQPILKVPDPDCLVIRQVHAVRPESDRPDRVVGPLIVDDPFPKVVELLAVSRIEHSVPGTTERRIKALVELSLLLE
jgi:hypothetical protein